MGFGTLCLNHKVWILTVGDDTVESYTKKTINQKRKKRREKEL